MSDKRERSNYVKGELIIKLAQSAKELSSGHNLNLKKKRSSNKFGIKELDDALQELKVTEISQIGPDVYLIRMPVDTDLVAARKTLARNSEIGEIDFNHTRMTM